MRVMSLEWINVRSKEKEMTAHLYAFLSAFWFHFPPVSVFPPMITVCSLNSAALCLQPSIRLLNRFESCWGSAAPSSAVDQDV